MIQHENGLQEWEEIDILTMNYMREYINPGTIPWEELGRHHLSNRAILLPQAFKAIRDLLKVVRRLERELADVPRN
jgi:hypothetical protein